MALRPLPLLSVVVVAASVSLALFGCGGSGAETTAAPAPVEWQACEDIEMGNPDSNMADIPTTADYNTALAALDMTQVKLDMEALLQDQKACWPVSGPHYGPLMVRLAWHCSGTYRSTDGEGGCTGGRQLFDPERSWPDNTNLDKARALLVPLKVKYGDALSWGDLFILAGTQAYRLMGMPLKRMCFGRVDEPDGTRSAPLNVPCVNDPVGGHGNCTDPNGQVEIGLIYVNPAGPLGVPDAKGSAIDVRRTFSRMGANDRDTVALIGGGHSIGKCHAACNTPNAAGDSPKEAHEKGGNIWQGKCGNGLGANTFTSGFDGYWTTNHTKWDNQFFKDLLDEGMGWESYTGPGGNPQWRPAKNADYLEKKIFRLTSDMALLEDPSYKAIVQEFAASQEALNTAFDTAWFALTTSGNGAWSDNGKCDDGTTFKGPDRMRSDEGPQIVV